MDAIAVGTKVRVEKGCKAREVPMIRKLLIVGAPAPSRKLTPIQCLILSSADCSGTVSKFPLLSRGWASSVRNMLKYKLLDQEQGVLKITELGIVSLKDGFYVPCMQR